jgi:hypothetical protein
MEGGGGVSSTGVLTFRGSTSLQKGLRHSYTTVDGSAAVACQAVQGAASTGILNSAQNGDE